MRILEVNYLSDYTLKVLFSNQETKIVDLESFLKQSYNPSITKFLDKKEFEKVEIDTGFLSWEEGEMELDADFIYTLPDLNLEKIIA